MLQIWMVGACLENAQPRGRRSCWARSSNSSLVMRLASGEGTGLAVIKEMRKRREKRYRRRDWRDCEGFILEINTDKDLCATAHECENL